MSNDQPQPARYDAIDEYKQLKALAEQFGVTIPLKAGFTPDDINAVMPLLRYKLPEQAIQETSGSKTGKGYDTTGYSYQAHIDRMNWIFGPTHWRWEILNETFELGETSTRKVKYTYFGDISVQIGYQEKDESGLWIWTTVWEVPPYPTDHESTERGSARKGMLTKGLKRATSTIGVGADAWLGVFDDDLITGAEPGERMATPARRENAPDDQIGERDFDYLLRLATKKGFTLESLQDWISQKSNGTMNKPVAEYTNAEFEDAKKLLFTIPQGKTIQDMQTAEERRPRERTTETPPGNPSGPQEGNVTGSGTHEGEPSSLDELVSCPDEKIAQLAKKHNLNPPPAFTETNRRPFCRALASIMKIA